MQGSRGLGRGCQTLLGAEGPLRTDRRPGSWKEDREFAGRQRTKGFLFRGNDEREAPLCETRGG